MARKKNKKKSSKKRAVTLFSLILFVLLAAHQCNTPQHTAEKSTGATPSKEKAQTVPPRQTPKTVYPDLEIPERKAEPAVSDPTRLICRTGYTLLYNTRRRIPEWVAWELTGKEVQGDEKRTDRFAEDPDIKSGTAQNSDYKHSGYDRGHMAPAGDMGWSKKAMEESFYYSNMCPQRNALNGGVWKDLEELSRKWAQEDSAIYITCGPVVDQGYKTIGTNKVVVPQRFFKVILSIHGRQPRAIGFLFKNSDTTQPLINHCTTVDEIEQITGFDFFPALNDTIENRIESAYDTAGWNWSGKSKRPKRR